MQWGSTVMERASDSTLITSAMEIQLPASTAATGRACCCSGACSAAADAAAAAAAEGRRAALEPAEAVSVQLSMQQQQGARAGAGAGGGRRTRLGGAGRRGSQRFGVGALEHPKV